MDLVDPRDPRDRDPDTEDSSDSSSGVTDAAPPDPAGRDDSAADLATDAFAALLGWHRGFDGEVHATPEAVERRETDEWWERRGER